MSGFGRGVLLAIDGGGSKTDVAVADHNGQVLSRGRGPGSVPQIVGVVRAVEIIDGLVDAALAQAGHPAVFSAGIYLSGLDLPQEVEEFRDAIADRPWSRSALVDNDTFALMRAGTADRQAVAVVCGTGINCAGRHRDGRVVRFPALGRISGDFGGGSELGELALWHAVRASDGRETVATVLEQVVPEAFGLPHVVDVVEGLHFGRIPHAELNRLVPALFSAAGTGDVIARDILDRQAEEVVTLATTALRRLGLLTEPVPVVLGGSLLARPGRLIDTVTARLAATAPASIPVVVVEPPVLGAALLAGEAAGLDAGALRALADGLRVAPHVPA